MGSISIKYVDHMGDDFRVFEAAKATLGGEEESGFVRGETDPTRLIHFLAKNKHITPFRHPQVTFECEAPIAIARQLGKHQIGFQWNERSMRYKDSVIDVYTPDMFRGRPNNLHEGSVDVDVGSVETQELEWSLTTARQETVEEVYKDAINWALHYYEVLLEAGLSPEQARFVLPQGMITRWVWTGSLYGWFEVWRQRSSEHAQYEARMFAALLEEHMQKLFPIAWNALKENK